MRMSLLATIKMSDDHTSEVLAIIDGIRLAKGDTVRTNAEYKLINAYGLQDTKKLT